MTITPALAAVGAAAVALLILGVIDIVKNGSSVRMLSPARRAHMGASNAGNVAVTLSVAAAGLFVQWAAPGFATGIVVDLADLINVSQ